MLRTLVIVVQVVVAKFAWRLEQTPSCRTAKGVAWSDISDSFGSGLVSDDCASWRVKKETSA